MTADKEKTFKSTLQTSRSMCGFKTLKRPRLKLQSWPSLHFNHLLTIKEKKTREVESETLTNFLLHSYH